MFYRNYITRVYNQMNGIRPTESYRFSRSEQCYKQM